MVLDPTILDQHQQWAAEEALTAYRAQRLRQLVIERASRRIEALTLYEPLPAQQAFHGSLAGERLVRGGNRSGKTVCAAVEVARAVTNRDPWKKYPERDGRCFLVGKDGKHLGQVMWRKLSRAGAFKIIRDSVTGSWRAFRPLDPADVSRSHLAKLAPALIPRRMIKEVAWENKKEGVPNIVRLVNGWELSFFSSLGKPPQGSDIDLCWFDEEIVDPDWYPEMSARLLDREGRFLWSATPQAGTDQLYDLHERCEKCRGDRVPAAQEFLISLLDNPHISPESKAAFLAKLSDPGEAAVRVDGEFAVSSFKVYPEFSMKTHGVPYFDIPAEWTRFAVVDPGHQVCAVLFAAVPPPSEGDYVYLFDELYLRNCDSYRFGEGMAQKCAGLHFYCFLIDAHAAMMTPMAAAKTVERQYAEALSQWKVKSQMTGSGFLWASDDVEGGINAVRGWMRSRDSQPPRLRVLEGKLPNLEFELKRYHYKRQGGLITDRPENRRHNHLVDCLRYLALYQPRWHKPVVGNGPQGGAIRVLRAKQKAQRARRDDGYVRLGPGKASRD